MRHALYRQVIASVLRGQGFGEKAVAQAFAGIVLDRKDCPAALRDLVIARLEDLGTDRAVPYVGLLNQQAIPDDATALCAQLAPVLIDHPADTGLNLACLFAIARLWPHATAEERPLLRTRFLNSVVSRPASSGSYATRDQLCRWQRTMPTAFGNTAPSVASLNGILSEADPAAAYRCLAEHLDPSVDLPTLSWVLGALSVNVLVRYHDPENVTLHVLLGTIASERLAGMIPPEPQATLLAQLAHQLWWCRQRANLPPVRTCLDASTVALVAAVNSGDLTLAQRAARLAAREPATFWAASWELLTGWLERRDEQWAQALAMVCATAWRAGEDALSPDDAAAMGSVLADLAHHRDRVLN
jgi:hypothetical protein